MVQDFLNVINDAILKEKYRIVYRQFNVTYNLDHTPVLRKEYTVQKHVGFWIFKHWSYPMKDETGMTTWTSLEDCEKYIFNECAMYDKPKIFGLIPSE